MEMNSLVGKNELGQKVVLIDLSKLLTSCVNVDHHSKNNQIPLVGPQFGLTKVKN